MKKMTFDEYDSLVDRLKENTYQCDNYWPTKEELREKMGNEINSTIPFLIWLVETNGEPETEEEIASKKYINKLLRENLKLYDKEDK
jgi:hypothetical protein